MFLWDAIFLTEGRCFTYDETKVCLTCQPAIEDSITSTGKTPCADPLVEYLLAAVEGAMSRSHQQDDPTDNSQTGDGGLSGGGTDMSTDGQGDGGSSGKGTDGSTGGQGEGGLSGEGMGGSTGGRDGGGSSHEGRGGSTTDGESSDEPNNEGSKIPDIGKFQ